MKLSEAILRGCEMTPKQAFGIYGAPGWMTCALGAAKEAMGVAFDTPATELFPGVSEETINQIADFNDQLKWSRERIAGWLSEKGL